MEKGGIPDAQLSASSKYKNSANYGASRARLNMQREGKKAGGWVPRRVGTMEWLQVDLGFVTTVAAVATQGRSDQPQFVSKYRLAYGQEDGDVFYYYRETGQNMNKVMST